MCTAHGRCSPPPSRRRWHIPHAPGAADGFHNNWWQYIVNYDEAIRTLPPPGADFRKARTAMYAEE